MRTGLLLEAVLLPVVLTREVVLAERVLMLLVLKRLLRTSERFIRPEVVALVLPRVVLPVVA